jgi:hypothetical protein
MTITVRSEIGRGRSTLAALITKALRDAGLPVILNDGEAEVGDAPSLLADADRLKRNLNSIAGRETLRGEFITVETVAATKPLLTSQPGT